MVWDLNCGAGCCQGTQLASWHCMMSATFVTACQDGTQTNPEPNAIRSLPLRLGLRCWLPCGRLQFFHFHWEAVKLLQLWQPLEDLPKHMHRISTDVFCVPDVVYNQDSTQ